MLVNDFMFWERGCVMKLCKSLAIIVLAITVLTGCTNSSDASETVEQTLNTTTSVTKNNDIVTTKAESQVSAQSSVPSTNTESSTNIIQITESGYPDKLYTEYFIDDRASFLINDIDRIRSDFSKTNEFIDFDFIVDPDPSNIPVESQNRAVDCIINDDELGGSTLTEFVDEYAKDEIASEYVETGVVIPKFYKGWEYDCDGDGNTERYMIVEFPVGGSWTIQYDFKCWIASALVYESCEGEMSRVGFVDFRPYYGSYEDVILLDYGKFKQLIFGGVGRWGELDDNSIYGVVKGKSAKLFSGRQSFYKQGCFLSFSGHQGVSAFMIYDTVENRYRTIWGYPADIRKLKEYDPDDAIPVWEDADDSVYYLYFVIGERYVIDVGNYNCCKYENGRFTNLGCMEGVVIYPIARRVDDSETPFDVDIDYALSFSGASLDN